MQIAKFEYTDAKGKITQRVAAIVNQPSNLLAAIDVSELSINEVEAFAKAHNDLKDKYMTALLALQSEFDLTHNMRNFKTSGMTNVETWYV